MGYGSHSVGKTEILNNFLSASGVRAKPLWVQGCEPLAVGDKFLIFYVGLPRTMSADHTCTISFDGQKKWKEKATRGASSGNIWLVGLPLWIPQVLFAHLRKTIVFGEALRR
ncbi:MAG: hypothetical protein ACOX60_02885 [Massiliimalia sp.]|jgi:hypothetical protein